MATWPGRHTVLLFRGRRRAERTPVEDDDSPAAVADPIVEGNLMAADTTNNEKIVQRAFEAFEAADERKMRECLAPDFVSHSAPPGFAEDTDGFVQLAKHLKAGMPDGKMTIHDIFAAGDKVAVRFTHAGTHQGDLFGVPASSRTLTVRAIEIYRLSGGKIAEYWGEYDTSELFGSPPGMVDAGEGAQQQS
jgi:steroid delta-isomerase-like uncharacterized protein